MSFVFDDALALMKAPHSRWPFVSKPFYVATDFPWLNGTPVWAQNVDFICDYDVQCIYPAPVVVYHDQGGGYYYDEEDPGPSVGWNNVGTLPFDFRTNQPHDFSEFHIKQDAASADSEFFGADAEVSCQGVTFLWSALDQNVEDAADPSDTKFTTFRVGVGWGEDLVIYSVRYIGQGDLKVAKSYDGGFSWFELESLRQRGEFSAAWGIPDETPPPADPPAEGEDPPEGGDAPRAMNYLEFRLIAGRLLIWAGNNATPYVFDENRVNADNGAIITINYLGIRAYKFRAFAASAHPTKWRTSAIYDSPEIPTGFYSENIGDPYIDPAGIVPAGWIGYIAPAFSYLFGPTAYFRLVLEGPVDGTFRGQDYSDYVAAVRAVNLFWRPTIDFTPASPIVTLPEKITVAHSFNADTLGITSSATVLYNNNRPRNLPTGQFGTWGEWLRSYGLVAMDFAMNRTTPDGFWGTPQQVASLYGNVNGEVIATPEGSAYKMTCTDRSLQLKNPRFALPWLDGWNVYYAMAYLAQLGGVDISEMDFAPYVPNVPFGPGSDLGSPEGPAYYLPVGDAGSVITRFSGVPLWECMTKIAYFIGYMLFFDVYGRLQFRRFTMPAGVKRSFYESDRASAIFQPGGGLEGCWDMRVSKDMTEVRNTSIVIGVNAFGPRYDPIVYKFTDGDSIYNPNVFNHLGFENPAVWMDSQFADESFAYQAAGSMYYFLRNPGYEVNLTTWLQPDIYPLDMILVQSPKLGTYNLRFMVTDVAHTVEKSGGSSQIQARYIPE